MAVKVHAVTNKSKLVPANTPVVVKENTTVSEKEIVKETPTEIAVEATETETKPKKTAKRVVKSSDETAD